VCYLDQHVFETWHQLFGRVRELVDVQEVVVSKRVQYGADDALGYFPALANHGSRAIQQDYHVLRACRRVYIPRAGSEVVQLLPAPRC